MVGRKGGRAGEELLLVNDRRPRCRRQCHLLPAQSAAGKSRLYRRGRGRRQRGGRRAGGEVIERRLRLRVMLRLLQNVLLLLLGNEQGRRKVARKVLKLQWMVVIQGVHQRRA